MRSDNGGTPRIRTKAVWKIPATLTFLDTLRDDRISTVHTPCNEDLSRRGVELLRDFLNLGILGEFRCPHHYMRALVFDSSGSASSRLTIVPQWAVGGNVDILLFAIFH